MNATYRKYTISRISRKAAKSVVKKINTVYGEEVAYLIKQCKKCKNTYSVHNFYVKKHKQHKKDEDLSLDDFRNTCIPCHDKESVTNRAIRSKERRLIKEAMLKNPELLGNCEVASKILASERCQHNLSDWFEKENG